MVVFVGTGKDILAVPVVDGFVVADVKFAFVNPELSRLRKQSAVQPRDIPRPAGAPLRTSILPAPLPKRCTEPKTLLRPARTRCSRPSARTWGGRNLLFPLPSLFSPGTAGPSPWLPLT